MLISIYENKYIVDAENSIADRELQQRGHASFLRIAKER